MNERDERLMIQSYFLSFVEQTKHDSNSILRRHRATKTKGTGKEAGEDRRFQEMMKD